MGNGGTSLNGTVRSIWLIATAVAALALGGTGGRLSNGTRDCVEKDQYVRDRVEFHETLVRIEGKVDDMRERLARIEGPGGQ